MNARHATLCGRLGYAFRDPELLSRALTHRSASGRHNERLEFLGDSVLNVCIAATLYEKFPQLSEGELTRLRANLVRMETLAELARGLELGAVLELGSGELKSGGFDRDSILADALEAVFGAIFRDGGFAAAFQSIQALYAASFDRIDPQSILKDPKTRLQEYLQKQSLSTPTYHVIQVSGEAHQQVFQVECRAPGLATPTQGSGPSRRNAEQQAAQIALDLLLSRDA